MIYCPECDVKHMGGGRHERLHAIIDALEENHGREYASVARRLYREEAINALATAAIGVGYQLGESERLFDEHDVETLADAVAARYDELETRRDELEAIRAGERPEYHPEMAGGSA